MKIINIDKNRKEIVALLKQTKIEGMNKLITHLLVEDFFTAPCSSKYHLNVEGGLAQHSLNVYRLFKQKIEQYKCELPERSIIICSILHDVCKMNFYKKIKDEKGEHYKIEDEFPAGHGEKSVIVLQEFIKLTFDEILAIRWHMSAFGDNLDNPYHKDTYYKAVTLCPYIVLLFGADYEATIFLEREEKCSSQ